MFSRFSWAIMAAIVVTGAAAVLSLRADNVPKNDDDQKQPAFEMPAGPSATDAQVVASMHKAIDFLLQAKKGDNWEVDYTDKKFAGGETALALYALLHAGQSLQDDPEYNSKLHWRSKEMTPVLEWVKKNPPGGTYANGLLASALTLLPKAAIASQTTDELSTRLEHIKDYTLCAMRKDGGYTYERFGDFRSAWQAYFDALTKGGDKAGTKKALDAMAHTLYNTFGGPEAEIQAIVDDLHAEQKKTKDSRELAKIDIELKELEKYLEKDMPNADDPVRVLDAYKRALAQLEARKGNPAGLTTEDPTTKKKTPMTKDELAKKIEDSKATVKHMEDNLKDSWNVYGDLSNSQYGMLGAWALSDFGMELPDRYWTVQDKFWRKLQLPDGTWTYPVAATAEGRPTMSVAGIASLFITQEFVDNELRLIPKPDKNIDAGLAWLAGQYDGGGTFYYLYGVERVGLNSGLKFFGTKDWYRIGANRLVKTQKPDGTWAGGYAPIISTSYGLLFLARGRNPVVFNKLQYNGPWNARPRDDAYVTRWMSKRFEKPINWQIVNLQVSPEEWLDAPILLITGSVDPKFTKEDIDKLRWFVNSGGMIFSTADGGTPAFTTAMKKYAGELVNKKYEMRQLPKNHELFSKELGVDLPNTPTLLGMSNGVRELWIHSSQDIGADWQMRKYSSKSFELGTALYFYASGRASLRSKLQPLTAGTIANAPARTIELARIDYPGNADPEPGAWQRMARLAHAGANMQVNISTVAISALDPKKYPLAHLTGTTKVTFTTDDVQALARYTDGGGLLFIDAAGGSAEFADSCRSLIKAMYPDQSLVHHSGEHPIFAGNMSGGEPVQNVQFRSYGTLKLQRRVSAGAIDAIETGGRTRVLFSQWDICSGFLGMSTWGIIGYAPATSESIGRNLLLYSLNPVVPSPSAE